MTRSVLITGAANGLGLVISRHLWQQGYQVAMADLNLDTVTRSAQEIDPSQQRLLPLALAEIAADGLAADEGTTQIGAGDA
ncbi:SDR family NAD(P)-dependent oxidoreductase, partial [Klebsiella aerogenes]|uniref:SDR family NAD(P)-dependent oxidoreductase n=1 Tax=Klebsiella aerogenes TaxID=548 RepID=UPI001D0D28C6